MSCNRIVVSTSRCGRDNPGSNPGYSNCFILNPFNAIFEALIFQFHFFPFDHEFQGRNQIPRKWTAEKLQEREFELSQFRTKN